MNRGVTMQWAELKMYENGSLWTMITNNGAVDYECNDSYVNITRTQHAPMKNLTLVASIGIHHPRSLNRHRLHRNQSDKRYKHNIIAICGDDKRVRLDALTLACFLPRCSASALFPPWSSERFLLRLFCVSGRLYDAERWGMECSNFLQRNKNIWNGWNKHSIGKLQE